MNKYEDVNIRALSPGCTPHPSMDHPIRHNGWEIYKWTGWKGVTWVVPANSYILKKPILCATCGLPFKAGEEVIETQGTDDIWHFACSDNPLKGKIVGQWLAVKKVTGPEGPNDASKYRFAYASTPGTHHAYERGDCFDVMPSEVQQLLSPEMPQEILEKAREDALLRLKKYIDDVESGVVPWPKFWGPKETWQECKTPVA
jgi:hypothetical protein